MELRPAIVLAGRHRLRPILLTAICTTLGLVPMSLGISEGAEMEVPLARVDDDAGEHEYVSQADLRSNPGERRPRSATRSARSQLVREALTAIELL
jgi:hypothetical protein